jgi:hypothetical protein
MDLGLATLKAISFYLLYNVSTLNQCRKLSCGTVVCKHFTSYQCYPNYRWDLIRYAKGLRVECFGVTCGIFFPALSHVPFMGSSSFNHRADGVYQLQSDTAGRPRSICFPCARRMKVTVVNVDHTLSPSSEGQADYRYSRPTAKQHFIFSYLAQDSF